MLYKNIMLSVVNLDIIYMYILSNEKVVLVWIVNRYDCCLVSQFIFVLVVGGVIGEVYDFIKEFVKVKEIGLVGFVFDEVIIFFCFFEERVLVVKIGVYIYSDFYVILFQFFDFFVFFVCVDIIFLLFWN